MAKMKKRKPQDVTQYALRGLRRRLARCEARLELLEETLAASPTLWRAWSALVAKK